MQRAGEALSVTILCLSAVLAWRLGFSLGASDVERHLLALISVALEGWKVLLPFVILRARREKRAVALMLALLLWPLLTAYSFVGGLGFSELNRATLAGTRGATVDRVGQLKAERADIETRLAALSATRARGEIDAAIERLLQMPIRVGADTKALLDATKACSLIVSKRSTDLCAELAGLREARARALERERLDARRASIDHIAASFTGLDWAEVGDPQVTALAALGGLDQVTTRRTINIVFAVLLELVGGLGLFFASLLATGNQPHRDATPAVADEQAEVETDEARLGRYLDAATITESGATIVASRLHADYSRWLHAEDATPVSLTTFGNLIARRGIAKEKVDGLMHYQGLRLAGDGKATS